MNRQEAERIATVVNVIRPDWRTELLMTVLGDDRMIHRPYADVLVAFTAMAADPTTKRPGRIHEPGAWWLTVSATAAPTPYRELDADDCATCSRLRHLHPFPSDPHEWEPQHARGEGERPAPDVRAAIDAAIAAAKHAAAAAKEEPAKKEPRDMNEVIASHTDRTDAA